MSSKAMLEGEVPGAFAEAFRGALDSRGLPLTRLRERLMARGNPISLATLSYWRSGARQPDPVLRREVIADIEEILALNAGDLAGFAARASPGNQLPPMARQFPTLDNAADPARAFLEAKQALNGPPDDSLRITSFQIVTDVGLDGLLARSTFHFLVECIKGTLDRFVFSIVPDKADFEPLILEVLGGGTVIDRYLSPHRTVQAVSVELDRPLDVGESAMVAIQLEVPSDGAFNNPFERVVAAPAYHHSHKLVNWVRFDPRNVPDWFEEIEIIGGVERRSPRWLDASASIHLVRWNFGPGSVTLRWGYGEPPDAGGSPG
ncbi:hypothetical protein [Psychromicrobium xiongbiense]|uniref:hypothetical protein n=1 Tax=Psychromicrobium xiongbiense TaxID=3051184 RepID=UPI002552B025|nr:hypothetical protein [Psychromicrobium sp. YIM S02556]